MLIFSWLLATLVRIDATTLEINITNNSQNITKKSFNGNSRNHHITKLLFTACKIVQYVYGRKIRKFFLRRYKRISKCNVICFYFVFKLTGNCCKVNYDVSRVSETSDTNKSGFVRS